MAKTSLIIKSTRKQKFGIRQHNRCRKCGRPRGYYRDFGICRICLRNMAHKGELPGVAKSSW